MNRFFSTMKTDFTVQVRNKLYTIGIGVAVLTAVALSQLASPEVLPGAVPALLLVIVGGSTMLYVAGMIVFEKGERTLHALTVSPLRPVEYLWSKIVTLTGLSVVESLVIVAGAMLIMSFSETLSVPAVPVLFIGIVALGIVYTLVGIILIVRYEKITEFLIPMSGVAVILQLPFLYLMGWIDLPVLLVIPTSAQGLLMRGAFVELATWEWVYAIGYTAGIIVVLTLWAHRAFRKHTILNMR